MSRARLYPWVGIVLISLGSSVVGQEDEPDPSAAAATASDAPRLAVLDRHIGLGRDEWLYWQVDYRLRYEGSEPLTVSPSALEARVDGLVSNSRVDAHATPRRSSLRATGSSGLLATADVLPASDEARRCRERLVLQAWPEAQGPEPPEAIARVGRGPVTPEELPTWSVEPGQAVRVRIRLEHQHPLYGPFEALLGTRTLELKLGGAALSDRLPLDHQRPVPIAAVAWPPRPTAEYLDEEVFLSAPDSLHLEAHVPGKQSYRFPDLRGIRYGSRMRLSFWYLVAPGTEGQCQVRVTQYRDLPNSWKTLHDGELTECLSTPGRWVHVERVFRIEPEATALTFDVRILGAAVNVGELWIDDVQIEPADPMAIAGP